MKEMLKLFWLILGLSIVGLACNHSSEPATKTPKEIANEATELVNAEKRRVDSLATIAEAERQAAEDAKKAEEEKQAAEDAKKAEAERQAAEDAKKKPKKKNKWQQPKKKG